MLRLLVDQLFKVADNINMKTILIIILTAGTLLAQSDRKQFDNNTAFFEGNNHNYIFYPPDNFIMNNTHATDDGLSFAYLPKGEAYEKATVLIGVNFFRLDSTQLKSFNLNYLINEDSTAFRKHYDGKLVINSIPPLTTSTGDSLVTFYLNDSTRFIPDVMFSYIHKDSEVAIFSLSIDESTLRFKAEEIFVDFINQIKILRTGKIEL